MAAAGNVGAANVDHVACSGRLRIDAVICKIKGPNFAPFSKSFCITLKILSGFLSLESITHVFLTASIFAQGLKIGFVVLDDLGGELFLFPLYFVMNSYFCQI